MLENEQISSQELPSAESISRQTEEHFGFSFKEPLVAIKDAQVQGETGNGTFDYASRTLIVNKAKVEREKNNSVEEILVHEAGHVLERDVLDGEPVHDHILHATFSVAERQRLIGMSGLNGEQLSFKKMFGEDFRAKFDQEQGVTADTILEMEKALLGKLENLSQASEKDKVIATIVAMDLDLIKTAYLAEVFARTNPKLVLDYEKKAKTLKPLLTLMNGVNIYSFEEEARIAAEVLA